MCQGLYCLLSLSLRECFHRIVIIMATFVQAIMKALVDNFTLQEIRFCNQVREREMEGGREGSCLLFILCVYFFSFTVSLPPSPPPPHISTVKVVTG